MIDYKLKARLEHLLAMEAVAKQEPRKVTDFWIGSISVNGHRRIYLDKSLNLKAAIRDTELKFGDVDWIFNTIEVHERDKVLEGTVLVYDTQGEPHDSYIELVRESYTGNPSNY